MMVSDIMLTFAMPLMYFSGFDLQYQGIFYLIYYIFK